MLVAGKFDVPYYVDVLATLQVDCVLRVPVEHITFNCYVADRVHAAFVLHSVSGVVDCDVSSDSHAFRPGVEGHAVRVVPSASGWIRMPVVDQQAVFDEHVLAI